MINYKGKFGASRESIFRSFTYRVKKTLSIWVIKWPSWYKDEI
jgi:hypothetical protein